MTPPEANPEQAAAIGHPIDRPLKVAAGPGTGKTHLLAQRYLHLLSSEGLRPHQILALTFTRRAAAEMRGRVARDGLRGGVLPSALDLADGWIGTFHSICMRLLQENPLAAGLPVSVAALDEVDRRRLRAALRERLLDGALAPPDWQPREPLLLDLAEDGFWSGLWGTIDRLQDLLVTPDEFEARARERAARLYQATTTQLGGDDLSPKERAEREAWADDHMYLPDVAGVVALLYRAYQGELARLGALDYPGQIMAAYRLLNGNGEVRARYRKQFRHILVDEVQDTSGAQMRLIAALASDGLANVTVIGDGKQSIYGWRGARPENLSAFAPLESGGVARTLRRNYRSHQEILDVAAHALRPLEEKGRVAAIELGLEAERRPAGRALVTVAAPSGPLPLDQARRDEAADVAARIAALQAQGSRGEEIVILMRSVTQAGLYADALRARGIPSLVVGGKGFFGRPEVRDALALLRAAADPLDAAALVRAMQGPLCGLSDAAIAAISRHGGHGQLYEGLLRAETLPFSVYEREEVVRRSAALAALLGRVGRRLEGLPLPDLLRGALEESGYGDYARTRPDVERERILANLEKLYRAARLYAESHPFDTVAAFARRLSYMFDEAIEETEESVDAGPEVVRIMTVHQAKGLEFPVVFVVNAMPRSYRQSDEAAMTYEEDEGFVLLRRRDPHTLEPRDAADSAGYKGREARRWLEEDRYVWYVALTRARDRLILSAPRRLDHKIKSNEQWPLQELYRAITGPAPDPLLAAAVAVEPIEALFEADTPHEQLPALNEALARVSAAAELAAREQPAASAPPPGPIAISYSALRTYRACPRRYQLQHALRLPAVPPALRAPQPSHGPAYDPTILGSAVHTAMERYPDAQQTTREELLRVFVASCRAQGLDDAEIDGLYAPRGERMLDLYRRGAVSGGQAQRIYAELAVRQLMRDGPVPVYLVGRVDRVELDASGWRIVDYKTHRALSAADVEEAAVQLRLYKAAWQAGAAAELGERPGDPALYVYDAANGRLHDVVGDTAALDAAVNLLCDVAGKIAEGDFAVPPGYDAPCDSCAFGGPYGLCPDRRNRIAAGDLDDALAGEVYGARRYDHGAAPGQYPMLGPNRLDEDQGAIPDAAGEAPATPTGQPCFLCTPEGRCSRAYLRGVVRDMQVLREEHGMRVRALLDDAGRETWLELAPPWQTLGPTLQELLMAGLSVRLAAYHLTRGQQGERPGYRATERSLVALDPDTLIDVTSIAAARFCARRSLIQDLARRGGSAAAAEGSAIHVAVARALPRAESPLAHLDAALRGAALPLSLVADGDDEVSTRERAEEHLRRVGDWLDAHRPPGRVRAEALLLSPGLGLRGRADAIFDPDGAPTVLDLKTGRSMGADPRPEHLLQMAAYDLLLRERGLAPRPGWLLYSGNAAGDLGRRVPVGFESHVEVMRLRNELAAITLLGRAPLSPYPGRCRACEAIAHCRTLSFLNAESAYALNGGQEQAREGLTEEDARFFRHYSALLRLEGRAAAASVQNLWRQTPRERIARGAALDVSGAARTVEALEGGDELWRFACANRSDLREGDVVLLSGGDPIAGEAEQGVVETATAEALVLRVRGALSCEPRLVDRYAVDSGWLRGLRTLWAWTQRPAHLRALVAGSASPRFDSIDELALDGVNERQRRAVSLALAARDYLLVQGPPGAGKTATIARMVRALRRQGRRVLLASFTNRAVDTMLAALDCRDLDEAVRLGGASATGEELRATLLLRRAEAAGIGAPEAIAELLDGAGIVAATVATLASAGYDAQRFDAAIVDEASQLTVPAILAALRLASRFILVGDDRQLPPVVQSEEAAAIEDGLSTTLFTLLRRRAEESGESACLVALEEQYRMNEAICAFPSAMWYDGKLRAGTASVAAGRLALDLAAVPVAWRAALDPARAVVFLDVAPTGGDLPNTSAAEARRVRELCGALIAGGVPSGQIGVIAPYRAQVVLIRHALRESGLGAVTVDTVDRFQGGERAAMLLSLVGGHGEVGRLLLDERRLNVALTRARHKLILLGHAAQLRATPLYAELLASIAASTSE